MRLFDPSGDPTSCATPRTVFSELTLLNLLAWESWEFAGTGFVTLLQRSRRFRHLPASQAWAAWGTEELEGWNRRRRTTSPIRLFRTRMTSRRARKHQVLQVQRSTGTAEPLMLCPRGRKRRRKRSRRGPLLTGPESLKGLKGLRPSSKARPRPLKRSRAASLPRKSKSRQSSRQRSRKRSR